MIEEIKFINISESQAGSVWINAFRATLSLEYHYLKKVTFSPKLIFKYGESFFYNRQGLEIIDGEIDFSYCAEGSLTHFFYACNNLKEVRFTKESLKYNLSIAQSLLLSDESIQSILDGLATVSSTQTLFLNSAVYAKLTEEQKQSATDKGWTITG